MNEWVTVLWTDDLKFNMCSMLDIQSIKIKILLPTLKCGGNIMVWGVFIQDCICFLHLNGIVEEMQHKDVLKNIILPYSKNEILVDGFSNEMTQNTLLCSSKTSGRHRNCF